MNTSDKPKPDYCFCRPSGSQRENVVLQLLSSDCLRVMGYQGFDVTRLSDSFLVKRLWGSDKFEPIWEALSEQSLQIDSVLDLGCAQGEIGLQFLGKGIDAITFVDHDADYCAALAETLDFVGSTRARVIEQRADSDLGPHDVVVALALIHWIFGATADFHSVAAIVRHLRSMTRKALVVEWVDAADEAVKLGRHLDFAPEATKERYSRDEFVGALHSNFKRCRIISQPTETREIWVAASPR